jgi:TetR/AcrR family tetracycline transcriptional repressor
VSAERRRPTRSPHLTKDAVVATALELLDREGAAALTIRRVAAACAVRGPSLYWHFRDKGELVDLVVDAALAAVELGDAEAPPAEQVALMARSFRQVLRAHAGLASLVAQRLTLGPNALEKAEAGARACAAAGLRGVDAVAAYYTVRNFVLGFVLQEQVNPLWSEAPGEDDLDTGRTREVLRATAATAGMSDRYPTLVALAPDLLGLGPDALFEFGLACLLNGLRLRSRATMRPARRATTTRRSNRGR